MTASHPHEQTAHALTVSAADLAHRCPFMAHVIATHGRPESRVAPSGFPGLAHIVVGQQVSVASAAAIWARFERIVQPLTADTYRALPETRLAEIGLSGPKKRTLARLCSAIIDGHFDPSSLNSLTDDDARAAIMALSGFGPWSADIYLMFCLGRPDAFAAGDLALQVAAQKLMVLDHRPDPVTLHAIAERWRPHRATAALILWHYYRYAIKPSSGAPG
jgi:DNA-3-methyladenine glycosylase II